MATSVHKRSIGAEGDKGEDRSDSLAEKSLTEQQRISKPAKHPLIGIFGGTFDPIHLGHLQAVSDLQAELNFDEIHWVLSARPPHKGQTSAPIAARFTMLELALADHPRFVADDTEIKRQEKSWTIDTVAEFALRFPDHRLCLIIGGDSLENLPTWHRYSELIEQVSFLVMARPGFSLAVPAELRGRLVTTTKEFYAASSPSIMLIEQTNYPVSSTQIRQLISNQGGNAPELKTLLPLSVLHYIQQHRSYTLQPMQAEQVKDHVVAALEDVKGQNIRVLDIGEISDFADYMVVASGSSDTHVKALAREASDRLRGLNVKPLNEDGRELGEWVLVDFGDVVLHVMRPEVREYYDLEKLWDEDVRELVKQHREQQDS